MSFSRLLPALLMALGAGCLAAPLELRAADRIWSALVFATNERPPAAVPKQLAAYAAGLKSVFGYNSFKLLGEKRQTIRKGTEEWLVPSRKLFLRMRCTDRTDAAYSVDVELYWEKRLLVTSDIKFARSAPIYIRGPQVGRGQLIFILEVQ